MHMSAQSCAWHRAGAWYLELLFPAWTWIPPSCRRLRMLQQVSGHLLCYREQCVCGLCERTMCPPLMVSLAAFLPVTSS